MLKKKSGYVQLRIHQEAKISKFAWLNNITLKRQNKMIGWEENAKSTTTVGNLSMSLSGSDRLRKQNSVRIEKTVNKFDLIFIERTLHMTIRE